MSAVSVESSIVPSPQPASATGMHWKARLRGHSFNLDSLAEVFREGDPDIGCDEERHYVESSAFDGLTEPLAVRRERKPSP